MEIRGFSDNFGKAKGQWKVVYSWAELSFYHKKPGKEEQIKFKARKIKATNKDQKINK